MLKFYLKSIASIGVVAVPRADAALLSDEECHLLKLLAVDVTVTVQVEHSESDLEMATRSWKYKKK